MKGRHRRSLPEGDAARFIRTVAPGCHRSETYWSDILSNSYGIMADTSFELRLSLPLESTAVVT